MRWMGFVVALGCGQTACTSCDPFPPIDDDGSPGSGGSGASGSGGTGAFGATGGSLADPGTEPWVRVPTEEVRDTCALDTDRLAAIDAELETPWLIVRHGKLCHESPESERMDPKEVWSTTKTFGALVTGRVAYETRNLPRTGPGTGAFSDEDRVDHWLNPVPYNPNARVAHVLAMVAHNPNLEQELMSYDTLGDIQINTLSTMLSTAIAQEPGRLGANLEGFTQAFMFAPLGMRESTWSLGAPTKTFAFSWKTTARDMARVGLLILNRGLWNGRRLVASEWTYRMTHPAFESSNTGYGYLTWVNSSSNHHFGGIPFTPIGLQQTPQSPGPCAPVSLHRSYPHGLSTSTDCNYDPPYDCSQMFDVGVWHAQGLEGHVIQGHPGLDMVIVALELGGLGPTAPNELWEAVRPAIVDADPTYAGNDAAFCSDYGSNNYAPNLRP